MISNLKGTRIKGSARIWNVEEANDKMILLSKTVVPRFLSWRGDDEKLERFSFVQNEQRIWKMAVLWYCKRNTRLVLSIHHGKLEIKLVSAVHRWIKRAYPLAFHHNFFLVPWILRYWLRIHDIPSRHFEWWQQYIIWTHAARSNVCKRKMWKFLWIVSRPTLADSW